jgi:hypothetical protein
MKLTLENALIQAQTLEAKGDEASTTQAQALRLAVEQAQASGQTEIDTDQALLDIDTVEANKEQQLLDSKD